MDLVDELRSVTSTLARSGIPYALCGGIAVTVHGAVRSTKDIDMLVREGDLARVLQILEPLGWRFRAAPMTFGHGTIGERRLQRVSKIDGPHVLTLDLILVEPSFTGVWEARRMVELVDGELCVVSLEGLAYMKRLAGRAQDLADLEKLGLSDEE